MNMQTEDTDDRILRNMSKGGPQTKANRPTKPRHRPSDIRTHRAENQQRSVASGAKGGLADPTWQPNRLSFGGKLDLILLKVVDDVSIFILAGTDLKELYKGHHTTLTTHTT